MSAISTSRTKRRSREKRAPGVPLVISDHALDARYSRGEIAVEHCAPDVGEGGNPNRNISRARVVWSYDRLHNCGAIDDDQRDACDKYAMLSEQERGASWQSGEIAGGRRPAWQKGHPILTAIQATAALRSVNKALGNQARALVVLLVVQNLTVREIARRFKRVDVDADGQKTIRTIDEKQVMGHINAALTRMAEHWEMVDRNY